MIRRTVQHLLQPIVCPLHMHTRQDLSAIILILESSSQLRYLICQHAHVVEVLLNIISCVILPLLAAVGACTPCNSTAKSDYRQLLLLLLLLLPAQHDTRACGT